MSKGSGNHHRLRELASARPTDEGYAPVVMGRVLDGARYRTWAKARGRAILVLCTVLEVLDGE